MRERSRKRDTINFILVHHSFKATSSLLCATCKESSTKSTNCTITINQTILTPCKNRETH